MTRLVISLAANLLVFALVIAFVRGIRFAGGSPLGIIVAAILTAVVLASVTGLADRTIRERARWTRLVAVALLGTLVGALWLVTLTQLGFGFEVGSLPAVRAVASLRSLAIGAVLLAGGAILVELFGRQLERATGTEAGEAGWDRRAILVIFLLSGAAGLVYEVVWARQLVLVFGNTTQAISAILTGYFGGIAIGSVIGGRIADRVRRPLRLYGVLELILVVVVLITPLLFRGLHELYRSSYASLAGTPTILQLIRYGLALLALAPATVLMGATLPTLSRHLARNRGEVGRSFGALYAANTVGAVVGTLVAGLLLIEIVGLTLTLVIGAAGSATAGLAALALDRRRDRASEPGPEAEPGGVTAADSVPETAALPVAAGVVSEIAPPPTAEPEVAADPWLHRTAIAIAFVSGATSLGYQLLWTRLLASGSGNTTYVFTLILSIFLIGIAVGAAVISRRMGRSAAAIATLGSIQLLIAALVLAGTVILSGQTPGIPFLPRVLLAVLPATLALGATLPLAASLVGSGAGRIGRDTGLLLGANTIGAIGGTFVVPFLLIPTIGSLRSIVLLALLNVATGLYLLLRGTDLAAAARRGLTIAGTALAVLAAIGLIVPNPLVVDPGATRIERRDVLLASAEDEIAAVQAGGTGADRQLLVGGTGMTRLRVDAKLMTYLPLMTRPDAKRLLVICFGMGSAYRSGLQAGLEVDGVELVPSVPAMLRWFYSDADQVLADPRGRLAITDGRNFVELSTDHYDLITVDPPPPIESSGTSVLYSREFYEASARRLTDGGVMMEWLPGSQSVDEFRSHVRTYKSVFPNVLLAFSPKQQGVYMLGSQAPINLETSNIRLVLDRVGILTDLVDTPDNTLTTADEWTAEIERLPWISGAQVDAFGASAPLIRDDRPVTEYFLLRRLFGPPSPRMSDENLRAVTPPR
ncbi:MAG: fused MFS/spermidine synthase [Chloroflexota bacterium]